jgi:hypothetical protein
MNPHRLVTVMAGLEVALSSAELAYCTASGWGLESNAPFPTTELEPSVPWWEVGGSVLFKELECPVPRPGPIAGSRPLDERALRNAEEVGGESELAMGCRCLLL